MCRRFQRQGQLLAAEGLCGFCSCNPKALADFEQQRGRRGICEPVQLLDGDMVESSLRSSGAQRKGRGASHIEARFQADHKQVGTGRPRIGKVTYDQFCCGPCKTSTSDRVLALCDRLLRSWVINVKHRGWGRCGGAGLSLHTNLNHQWLWPKPEPVLITALVDTPTGGRLRKSTPGSLCRHHKVRSVTFL